MLALRLNVLTGERRRTLWLPTGRLLDHGGRPIFFFRKVKKNNMAFIFCLLRTQLSLQVGRRYQIRFLIIDQTLAIIFKTTIFNALLKNAQLQWFHSKWF